MPNNIVVRDDYNGSIVHENEIISQINNRFRELDNIVTNNPRVGSMGKYILDSEFFSIELYFAENKKKAVLTIDEEIISIFVNGKETKIDSNGDVLR